LWLSSSEDNLVYYYDEKESSHTGFYPKNSKIPSSFGSIYGFNKYEGPPTNERILGEIDSDFRNSDKMYCLTPTHLIEITKQFHQSFSQQIFGGSSYKYKFGEKLALTEQNIFEDNSPLTRFLKVYCETVFSLDELYTFIKDIELSYQADWTMSNLKNLTNEQGKRLSKVCIELEKVTNTLTQICQNQLDSVECFCPYWVKPIFVSFDINTNFISFINAIELCSKSLASIISIKNEMLLAVIEDNNTRFDYLVTKLEDSGIFMTYFETQSLEKSDEMIKTLKEGFASVSGALLEISSNLNSLSQSVTTGLNELNENVRMNNVLQGIQSYQLYRLNKS
jgi:hypothetical protein